MEILVICTVVWGPVGLSLSTLIINEKNKTIQLSERCYEQGSTVKLLSTFKFAKTCLANTLRRELSSNGYNGAVPQKLLRLWVTPCNLSLCQTLKILADHYWQLFMECILAIPEIFLEKTTGIIF